jgi:hypothetical protein
MHKCRYKMDNWNCAPRRQGLGSSVCRGNEVGRTSPMAEALQLLWISASKPAPSAYISIKCYCSTHRSHPSKATALGKNAAEKHASTHKMTLGCRRPTCRSPHDLEDTEGHPVEMPQTLCTFPTYRISDFNLAACGSEASG